MMENISNKLHTAGEKVVDMLPSKVQDMMGVGQKEESLPGKQYPLEGASVNKQIHEDTSGQDWDAVKRQDDKVLGMSDDTGSKDQSALGKVLSSVTETIGSTYHSIKENVVGDEEARLRGHEADENKPKWAVDEEEEGGLDTDDASFGIEALTDSNRGVGQNKRGQLNDFSVARKKQDSRVRGEVSSKSITAPSAEYNPEPLHSKGAAADTFDAPLTESPYQGGKLYGGKNSHKKMSIENTSDCDKKKGKKWAKGRFDEQRDLRVAAQKLGHFSEQTIKAATPEQLEAANLPLNY